jgi:hypothetical protein
MKVSTIIFNALLAGSVAQAHFICPVTAGAADAGLVEFGLAIQSLLSDYYESVPVNASFFSTLPKDTGTDFLSNAMGLAQQAVLGTISLQQLQATTGASTPSCKYTFPPTKDAMSFFMNAYDLEATLCGTFIGLADYIMSPQAAFVMSRLAAEHGIHASYIGSHFKRQVFMASSTSLTPAFTPQEVLLSGTGVGKLGQYLNGCVVSPMAACNGTVSIGALGSNVTDQTLKTNTSCTSASTTTSMSATSTMSTGNTEFPM